MRRLAVAVALALASFAQAAAPAPVDDPLQAPECRRALDALRVREAALAAEVHASGARNDPGTHGADAKLIAARKAAASACLARRADVDAAPSRFVVPPLPVAPVTAAPAPRGTWPAPPRSRAEPPAPTRPAVAPERPYAITSCDAGGCWANDGTRLNRVGPNLVGPRGFCSVQGSLVQCP